MLGLGNGLVYQSGIFGGIPYANSASVLFDGTDDYGEIADNDLFSPVAANGSGFTISFWINCVSSAANVRIINKVPTSGSSGFEWQVRTDGNSKPKVFFYMDGTASAKATLRIDTGLTAGQWHHIAYTWNLNSSSNTGIIGFLDGAQKTHGSGATFGSGGTSKTVTNGGSAVRAARFTGNYSNVYLDEISLFNNVVDATGIAEIYNSGEPIDLLATSDLVGYWRMGEGDDASGTTITDLKNGNDMTLINDAAIDSGEFVGA